MVAAAVIHAGGAAEWKPSLRPFQVGMGGAEEQNDVGWSEEDNAAVAAIGQAAATYFTDPTPPHPLANRPLCMEANDENQLPPQGL